MKLVSKTKTCRYIKISSQTDLQGYQDEKSKSELIIEAKITANNSKYGYKDFVGCLYPI